MLIVAGNATDGFRNDVIVGVENRRKHVRKCIERKYKRYASSIVWEDDELKNFGPRLKQYIAKENSISKEIRRRILWTMHCWEPAPRKIDRHLVITSMEDAEKFVHSAEFHYSYLPTGDNKKKCKSCAKRFVPLNRRVL